MSKAPGSHSERQKLQSMYLANEGAQWTSSTRTSFGDRFEEVITDKAVCNSIIVAGLQKKLLSDQLLRALYTKPYGVVQKDQLTSSTLAANTKAWKHRPLPNVAVKSASVASSGLSLALRIRANKAPVSCGLSRGML